jgi:hypothetical protein
MKAREAIHLLQSDPRFHKNKYYAEALAKHLFGMQEYEMREMLEKLRSADLEWDLQKFIDHIESAPGCARMKLLLNKLMENSCCMQNFIASFLAGIVCYRIDMVLGKDPNVSLH